MGAVRLPKILVLTNSGLSTRRATARPLAVPRISLVRGAGADFGFVVF